MPLCFIEPQNAIRVIAESVGREARRQLLGEVVRAWVDEIPEPDLEAHYAKAIADLDEHDLHMLAAWHASLEVRTSDSQQGVPDGRLSVPRREPARGAADRRRVPWRRGFQGGSSEEEALDTVLPWLSTSAAYSLRASASSSTCGTVWAARTQPGPARPRPPIDSEHAPAPTVDDVMDALSNVIDPELGLDFVELGLIYGVEVDDGQRARHVHADHARLPDRAAGDRADRRVRRRTGRREDGRVRDGLHAAVVAGEDEQRTPSSRSATEVLPDH